MELKVWVEGIQRVVCGVCDRTTCQDVVYALAHATGKTGRFTLIERWRNNERLLAPHEHPLKVLMKWGEYSSDVHFILQRTALDTTTRNSMQQQQQQNNKSATSRPTKTSVDPLHGFTPPLTSPPPSSNVGAVASIVTASPSKDLKKSLTFSGGGRAGSPNEQRSRHPLNVGVVRGVPKRLENGDDHQQQTHGPQPNGRLDWPSDKSPQVPAPPPPPPPPLLSHYQDNPSSNEEQLVYPRYDPPYGRVRLPLGSNGSSGGGEIPTGLHYSNPSPGAALSNQQDSFQSDLVRFPPPYRNPPPPSSGGSRQPPPPPYREPPRPSPVGGGRGTSSSPYRSSPAPPMTPSPGRSTTSTPSRPSPIRYCEMNVQQQQQQQQQLTDDSYNAVPSPLDSRGDGSRRSRRNLRLELSGVRTPSPPSDPHQAQLIQRVNRQRGDLDGQQERLVQLEQELLKWEERVQRQLDEERRQLDCELTQLEGRCRDQENQLSDLFDVEAECERTCREGEELTQELARWRTDVSALDLQLDQCEPTLSRLKVDLNQAEERLTCELEQELTRVKSDLDAAGQQEHNMNEEDEIISQDLLQSEAQVRSLRTQMDQLTQEIKQANLQSLSIAPTDDLKILLEGHSKTGHSRRMLGSPRQLENPVPTNKNPHGVWV